VRLLLASLLLILQLGQLAAPGLCLLGQVDRAEEECSHEDSREQQGSSGVFSPLTQPGVPAETACGAAGWCLAGWLMAGRETALRLSLTANDGAPGVPEAFLKSIHGSPPVPPPIV
jgi:hypothetical protein